MPDVFDKTLEILSKGTNIFITGGGGVGKSYLLNKLKEYYKENLVITSTTGISALNIGGQTLHSWCGIGIADKPVESIVKSIKRKPTLYKQILMCKMLAIDEISMLDNYTMEYVDEVLRKVREDKTVFGGIQVILIGDFFQLPPVNIGINSKDFCFTSHTWTELNLTTIFLNKVHRQTDDYFIKALNNVRIDKTSANDLRVFYERDYPANYEVDTNILQLFGTNKDADSYNFKCFSEIDARPYAYKSLDTFYLYSDLDGICHTLELNENASAKLSPKDYKCYEQFDRDCKAPKTLELKEGCRVMLLKNLNISKGLVNGACGTIKNLTTASIDVLFDNGIRLNLEPIDFDYNQDGKVKINRKQYPLRLAYGITIHKSQGMTFDKLVVNFNKIFDYGQAYVALSRVKSLDGLILKNFNHNKIVANDKVIKFYNNLLKSKNCFIMN